MIKIGATWVNGADVVKLQATGPAMCAAWVDRKSGESRGVRHPSREPLAALVQRVNDALSPAQLVEVANDWINPHFIAQIFAVNGITNLQIDESAAYDREAVYETGETVDRLAGRVNMAMSPALRRQRSADGSTR